MPGNEEGFVLVGAGLPRTGTLSTSFALKKLLKGNIYHMKTVMGERPDHRPFWRETIQRKISPEEWRKIMDEFRGGVDYPVSLFYKELMEAYPEAKVLLNVRDPVKWYQSVKDSILRLQLSLREWPCSWFTVLIGRSGPMDLVNDLCHFTPDCSSSGLGMFKAVMAGEETAVQFYNDHVNEVKSHVPADRLLVWEVKEGWGPLANFLNVPVPEGPFPRVNDTAEMNGLRIKIQRMSWFFIVIVPLLLAICGQVFSLSPLGLLAGYVVGMGLLRLLFDQSVKAHGKPKDQ